MIKYRLVCRDGHEFEAWFRNGAEFEPQQRRGCVSCPSCASTDVDKAPMAPRLSNRADIAAGEIAERRRAIVAELTNLREAALAGSEYVGARFSEEARRIHYREADDRAIHGEASYEEALALCEEGIAVLPLPPLPDDQN